MVRELQIDYLSLLNHLPDAVLKFEDGVLVWCNNRAEEVFGCPNNGLLGKNADFFLLDDTSILEPDGKSLSSLEDGVVRQSAGIFQKGDGSLANIEYFFSRSANQGTADLIVVARDITGKSQAYAALQKAHEELQVRFEKRTADLANVNRSLRLHISEKERAEQALRESEGELRLMFESVTDGILVSDLDGQIVKANEAAVHLHGYSSKDELIGLNAYKTIAEKDHELARENLKRTLKDGRVTKIEYSLRTKDGSELDAELSATPLPDASGRPIGLIAITRDISERKKAEEKLQELYKQERELRQQIEMEMKRRLEFTRELAHELKTPLTSVLASSDLLLSKLHDEHLQDLAKNINRSALNLNNRVDELLDLARGEVGMLELKLESIDVLKVIRDVANTISPVTLSHGQSLVLDLPSSLATVRADEDRIQQVLLNLLGNAIKFTPRDGKIILKAQEKDNTVVVQVHDTGRGMTKEEQDHLFERYHRSRASRWRMSGLGLGLALCKTLVELHGGDIWAKSHSGRGSTFGFSLPVETVTPIAVEEDSDKLWKVLIIEDDKEIVDFVSLSFKMDWPEVELLSTRLGEEGIDLVEEKSPDIVILDLGLPDMDGLDVLKQIRLFSKVPVVILTVKSEESYIIKGLELGADDYVAKPFRQMELLARLKVQLRKQSGSVEESPIIAGPFRFDPAASQLSYGRKDISLTVIEGRIIQQLMLNTGHVVTHSRLAEVLWGEEYTGAIEALRVHIGRLREKVEEDPHHPKFILTKTGIGYLLVKQSQN